MDKIIEDKFDTKVSYKTDYMRLSKSLLSHLPEARSQDFKDVQKALVHVLYPSKSLPAAPQVKETPELAVAFIVSEIGLDAESIISSLVWRAYRDKNLDIKTIESDFGPKILKLVKWIDGLSRIQFGSINIHQAENFRKFLLAMSKDIRVLMINLACRLQEMRVIAKSAATTQSDSIKALETLEIYAPLTERMGIQKMKNEMQDICFQILQPDKRKQIIEYLSAIEGDHIDFINSMVNDISTNIAHEIGMRVKVYGRIKTPYSIFKKMNYKKVSLDELSDIVAFRVIVNEVEDCYRVLYAIHKYYRMVPETFTDFISTPKSNGYRSVHTVVAGSWGQKIEIQIRTKKMHAVAELGLAAHWQYKQHYYSIQDGAEYGWVREMLSALHNASNITEFLSHTDVNFYNHEVFCFTRDGTLKVLPRGATVIDFAYLITADTGNHCTSAKINGKLVPINAKLSNGDQIEIVIDEKSSPSPDWQNFAITAKAHSEIKKFLRAKQREHYINVGRQLFYDSCDSVDNVDIEKTIKSALIITEKTSFDELLCDIGRGDTEVQELFEKFLKIKRVKSVSQTKKSKRIPPESQQTYLHVKGLPKGVVLHRAECCRPVPYDDIVAHISGKDAVMHVSSCEIVRQCESGKVIQIYWDKDLVTEGHNAKMVLLVKNQLGSVAALTAAIFNSGCNITDIRLISKKPELVKLSIAIGMRDKGQLDYLISNINTLDKVSKIVDIG